MFFVSLGMFYGADMYIIFQFYCNESSAGTFIANILLVAIGNVIGGGILIGGSEYYMQDYLTMK